MSEEQGQQPVVPQLDEAQIGIALNEVRSEQNLVLGVAAGAAAAVAGAILWALVTYLTNLQIGWMAVGIGFLVGFAIRSAGKGIDKTFGIAGAILALLGCGAGNLLAVCAWIANGQEMGYLEVLSRLDLQIVQELMVESFSPMDVLFYGIAVYEGYRLSFRELTEAEVAARITGQTPAT